MTARPAGRGAEPASGSPSVPAGGPAPGPGDGAECAGGVCVTCADTAVPVRVVALHDDDLAVVDTGTAEEEISVALVDARPGDTVLVHAGEAIAVVRAEDPPERTGGDGTRPGT